MASRWRVFGALFCLAVGCDSESDAQRGAPCERSRDCGELTCRAEADANTDDLAPLALTCESELEGSAAADSCERGADCASGICALAGTCVEPCAAADDCGGLERCQPIYARGQSGRLHGVSACVASVDLPRGAKIEVAARPAAYSGGFDTLMLAGSAEPTLFVVEHLDDDSWPVPPSATSCRPPLCAVTFAPRDSGADPWFDRDLLDDPDGPINPVAIGDHVYPLTVLVPNGPRPQPTAAGYRLEVETKRRGTARITTLSRAASGGRLDLNLFYVGAAEFEDAGDEVPETIAGALENVDQIFEPAGIFIGDVRQIHVTGALLDRGADLPDAEVSRGFARLKLQYRVYPQLPELFKLSAAAGNTALDIFFVSDIDAQGEADLGGITGSTPVPFGMHGTGASGIAIASDMLAGDSEGLGRALAHEIGHALGLFHTTETNGDVFDPLPDTPACDPSRDARGDGLDANDCDGAGADNLMFPTTNASAAKLSDDQAAVLRRAMILQ